MASLENLVQRVKDTLYGVFPTEAPFVTQLGASYTAIATSITVLDEDQWEVNDVCENTETGEQLLVVAKPGSDVLTVIRGWNSTTASPSDGSDDVLFKNPRFPVSKIEQAITDTLLDLERWDIHVFGNGTITRADPQEFYELSETDLMNRFGVLKIYEVHDNREFPVGLLFRYQHSLGTDPTEYDQGQGVYILDWGTTTNGEDVYFIYAQKIDGVDDLLARQENLVVVGAVSRLLGMTIVPATHDPGARTDRTVQPGQTSRDVRHFQARFITEARQETAQLAVERQHMLKETPRHARARRWSS